MEMLLRKAEALTWSKECPFVLNILKEKLVSALIIIYPEWNKQFHVHINASKISLGAVLAQPGEGSLDHLIYFSSKKLSSTERNYTMTEREALAMVYSLPKFRQYFHGGPFNFFTIHSALKYMVNKIVIEGRISR